MFALKTHPSEVLPWHPTSANQCEKHNTEVRLIIAEPSQLRFTSSCKKTCFSSKAPTQWGRFQYVLNVLLTPFQTVGVVGN